MLKIKITKTAILFSLIVFLAAYLRFFHLSSIPSGFIPEEVSTGWNAYSILHTGRDEWGTILPLIFRETGGFKLILNSYLIVPVMAIFGMNEFSVRTTTAVAGILTVIFTYFLSKEMFKRKKIALLSSLFLTLSPWHIAMSRYGVDVNWGIPLFLSGLLFFLKSRVKPQFLILSGIFFALSYHTYFNYIVFTFLFILFLITLDRKRLINISARKYLIIFVFVQLLFLLPFVLGKNIIVRFSQATSVGNIGMVNRINEKRQACLIHSPGVVCQFIYNKPLENIQEITKNVINHYSTTTFFLYGSNLGLSGMPGRMGFFHLFEFPLLILGLIAIIKKGKVTPIIPVWAILYGIPSGLAGSEHIWRMLTLLPLPQIIEAFGLLALITLFRRRIWVAMVITLLISLSFLRFAADYYQYFPFAQGANGYYGFKNLYGYLGSIEKDYDYIVVAPLKLGFNQLYIYYLFYNKYNPSDYQKGIGVDRRVGDQNWVWVDRIGKWFFVGEPTKVKYPLTEKTLLIYDSLNTDEILYDKSFKTEIIHTISYPNGDPAFYIMKLSKKAED